MGTVGIPASVRNTIKIEPVAARIFGNPTSLISQIQASSRT